ncbi:hypothetical protein D5S17_35425 [Pseudonocardiaceae bacterium YIM PH 21723]|nr:hypothetical protein D5S17_35425 [Pseudonocardiaceae bacterium YIM PH 21723]
MVHITTYTEPGSAQRPNEDWVGTTNNLITVLDGVSAYADLDGCHHGTPWFVANLGIRILTAASDPATTLPDALADAIRQTNALHEHTCRLTELGTPAAAVAIVRVGDQTTEWLGLADTTIALVRHTGELTVHTDNRVDHIATEQRDAALATPLRSPEHPNAITRLQQEQRLYRNTRDGYWVAGTDSSAAYQAETGTLPTRDLAKVLVTTDGAARIVDVFQQLDWQSAIDSISLHGLPVLVRQTRELEAADPDGVTWRRYKPADDATAALMTV